MNEYEERVAKLKSEGMTSAEARKIALSEIRALKYSLAEETRKDTRQLQANARIAISVVRIITRLFRQR